VRPADIGSQRGSGDQRDGAAEATLKRAGLSKDKEPLPSEIQRTFTFVIARSPDCTKAYPGQIQGISRRRMASKETPASSHLRMMELRIEQQIQTIERLRQAGQDTADADRRLALLQHALNEMRIQLGQLSPNERDGKRPDKTRSAPARESC
jgi:hypothetical protein